MRLTPIVSPLPVSRARLSKGDSRIRTRLKRASAREVYECPSETHLTCQARILETARLLALTLSSLLTLLFFFSFLLFLFLFFYFLSLIPAIIGVAKNTFSYQGQVPFCGDI